MQSFIYLIIEYIRKYYNIVILPSILFYFCKWIIHNNDTMTLLDHLVGNTAVIILSYALNRLYEIIISFNEKK